MIKNIRCKICGFSKARLYKFSKEKRRLYFVGCEICEHPTALAATASQAWRNWEEGKKCDDSNYNQFTR